MTAICVMVAVDFNTETTASSTEKVGDEVPLSQKKLAKASIQWPFWNMQHITFMELVGGVVLRSQAFAMCKDGSTLRADSPGEAALAGAVSGVCVVIVEGAIPATHVSKILSRVIWS
jgi:hypothetical protein